MNYNGNQRQWNDHFSCWEKTIANLQFCSQWKKTHCAKIRVKCSHLYQTKTKIVCYQSAFIKGKLKGCTSGGIKVIWDGKSRGKKKKTKIRKSGKKCLQKMATLASLLISTPLCNVILQFLLSRGGIYFFWIWVWPNSFPKQWEVTEMMCPL